MDTSIKEVTRLIEEAIRSEMRTHTTEEFWVTHYGANDIHPKHLVYWVVVRSEREKLRLNKDILLVNRLRGLLEEFAYPIEGRSGMHIGFESHETVDREAGGNFYHYWK